MDIRKLTISEETRGKILSSGHLNRWQKGKIRLEGVKAYIRSKPDGTIIKTTELARAAGYRSDQTNTGRTFIYYLVKSGKLIKNNNPNHVNRATWAVPSGVRDVKTVTRVIEDIVSTKSTDEDYLKMVEEAQDEKVLKKMEDEIDEIVERIEDGMSSYSFEFKLTKRSESGDYGKQHVAQLDISDTTLSKVKYMINELVDNV